MELPRSVLLEERAEILTRMAALGEFRRGTVSVNYRKCGKPTCWCSKKGERGHGPQHLWNATIGGKSYARNLATAAEVKQCEEETSRYREFQKLCERLIEINERLCELSVVVADEEAAQVKKKRQKRSPKNSARK